MMRVLDPVYTFRVELRDKMQQPSGNNMQVFTSGAPPRLQKFFDGLNGKSGCDEAMAAIKDALKNLDCEVHLERFEHK